MASEEVFEEALEELELREEMEMDEENTFVPDIKKLLISILNELPPTKRSMYAEKVKELWYTHEQLHTVLVFNTDETCDTKEELRRKIINQGIKKDVQELTKKKNLLKY